MCVARFLIGLLVLLLWQGADSQTVFWQDVTVNPALGRQVDPTVTIRSERHVSIRLAEIQHLLADAPPENQIGNGRSDLQLVFPLPDGSTETFRVYHSPLMEPGLAARYPNIQAYRALGVDEPTSRGRFDYGPDGFSAVLQTRQGEVWIDLMESAEEGVYRVYFARDLEVSPEALPKLSCGYQPAQDEPADRVVAPMAPKGRSAGDPIDLRVYTIALACTGEYAQSHGGTVEDVLSSMNRALTRLNEIYENELAIRIILMENNDQLIWLDPQTDPFINSNNGQSLLGQINEAFTTVAGIPITAFDLGHLFTGGCNDVGGVVSGRACNANREKGVTCHSSNNINLIVRRVMAHEVGHQFSASHTFSNCPGSNDQLEPSTAEEPGSGSTIMSYAGTCGGQNVLINNDDYFHVASLEEIIGYTRQGTGRTCASRVSVDNTEPEISLAYPDHFYIPISTPFQLTASATDAEDDPLTYCWEQADTGPVSNIGNPMGTAPLFRSLRPSTSPTRIFPRPSDLVVNVEDPREVLPDYGRNITFKVTVRDNHPGAGAAVWEAVNFTAIESAGPFRVLSPNTNQPTWNGGTYQEVTWDVANTDQDSVNCQYVNILLSSDGGFNFPFVLAAGVPNTGSAMVAIPDIETTEARIKVEAADNIFFDISNRNFLIEPAISPSFTWTADAFNRTVCAASEVEFLIQSQSILGFAETIELEVVDGLPDGASAAFSSPAIVPGEATKLQISLADLSTDGRFAVTVRATADGAAAVEQVLYLEVISTDFSDLQILSPLDGTSGIGLTTDLIWSGSARADQYEVQIATNPSFAPEVLLDEAVLPADSLRFIPGTFLEENTLYYWRLRPINDCGPADFLPVQTFHTETLACTELSATDTPVVIPGSGLPTKESFIEVDVSGIISDLNLPIVRGNYQPVSSLRFTLISPAGTEVILFDGNCGNTTDLSLGFDDDAPEAIQCPPDDGIVFQPENPLAAFNGENTMGTWTLRVQVISSGFGGVGSIGDWKLEFCASLQPQSPFLVTNDTLYVPPTLANPITTAELEAQDADNTADELIYTLVEQPQAGILYYLDQPLRVGDQFRQSTIDAFNLYYQHEGEGQGTDHFLFVVEDGTGGWIPPQQFNIRIDENAVVDVDEPINAVQLRLFPNPASTGFTLRLTEAVEQAVGLSLFDARGRRLYQSQLSPGEREQWIDTRDLPSGVYWLRLQWPGLMITRKVVVHRL